MTVSQISVFAESKPGHLLRVLTLFEEADVNVRGYSAADTGEYGILRFVVDDPAAAISMLKREGLACVSSEVLCLRLEDKPGELARVVGVLSSYGVNVTYSYSLISTYIIISTHDTANAEKLLCDADVELVDQAQISGMSLEREKDA